MLNTENTGVFIFGSSFSGLCFWVLGLQQIEVLMSGYTQCYDHLINHTWLASMGESLLACGHLLSTQDLGQDAPVHTSHLVNKNHI